VGGPPRSIKGDYYVHNYHCKRDTGLVRVGLLHGPRMGAWYLDHGMVARDGVARAASSKTRALKTRSDLGDENRPAILAAERRVRRQVADTPILTPVKVRAGQISV
jgi:hypothetical protein